MNKTLLKSVREYKKQSVLAPFFVILEVLMEVLIPMEMAKIIDVGIMQGKFELYRTAGIDSGHYGNAGSVFRYYSRKNGSNSRCRICQKPET